MTAIPSFNPTTHPYRWAMLAGVWLVYFCFGLTVAAMAPLVGAITDDLGLSYSAMGSVFGAWPLVYVASAIPCGALLDRIGPRRGLLLAALVIALSGALRGLAESHVMLFLAVAIFGLGGPLVSVGAPKLISLWFESKDRGLAMGLYISGPALGGIVALSLTNSAAMPLAGGDWRAVLIAYAAFVLFAGALWFAISAHPASRAVEARIAAEPRRPSLEVFGELLKTPAVRLVLLMGVAILFVNHGLANWLPQILRGHGMDDATAGYWASIPHFVGVGAALVIPRFATPRRRFAILLALVLCTAGATLMLHSAGGPVLASGLILQGLARGSLTTVTVLILMETREVGSRRMGAAGGLFFSAAEVGGVLGPLAMGTIHDLTGGFASALYFLTGVCAVVALLLGRLWSISRAAPMPAARGDRVTPADR